MMNNNRHINLLFSGIQFNMKLYAYILCVIVQAISTQVYSNSSVNDSLKNSETYLYIGEKTTIRNVYLLHVVTPAKTEKTKLYIKGNSFITNADQLKNTEIIHCGKVVGKKAKKHIVQSRPREKNATSTTKQLSEVTQKVKSLYYSNTSSSRLSSDKRIQIMAVQTYQNNKCISATSANDLELYMSLILRDENNKYRKEVFVHKPLVAYFKNRPPPYILLFFLVAHRVDRFRILLCNGYSEFRLL